MKKVFEVSNIECEGCANTIKKRLVGLGFDGVEVDLNFNPKRVSIELDSEDKLSLFKDTLNDLDFIVQKEL